MNIYDQIADALTRAKKITVLTGAGISVASGIPDFRSINGIYYTYPDVEKLLTRSYFNRHPDMFWSHFKQIFNIEKVKLMLPNRGHIFLKKLEDTGKDVTILTQNIDGLHHLAGNRHVIELHGTLFNTYCTICKRKYKMDKVLKLNEDVPKCLDDGSILKPDIVLFEEGVRFMEEAYTAVCETDLFLTLGTSLEVYPVNTLPSYTVNARNMTTVLVNKEPTIMDNLFQYVLNMDIIQLINEIEKSTYWKNQ